MWAARYFTKRFWTGVFWPPAGGGIFPAGIWPTRLLADQAEYTLTADQPEYHLTASQAEYQLRFEG